MHVHVNTHVSTHKCAHIQGGQRGGHARSQLAVYLGRLQAALSSGEGAVGLPTTHPQTHTASSSADAQWWDPLLSRCQPALLHCLQGQRRRLEVGVFPAYGRGVVTAQISSRQRTRNAPCFIWLRARGFSSS